MDIYKFALDIQDGVNLSGIVHSWGQATEIMWKEARAMGHGTEYVNHHPVNVLLLDKLSSLAGYGFQDDGEAYRDAYHLCQARQGKTQAEIVAMIQAAYAADEEQAIDDRETAEPRDFGPEPDLEFNDAASITGLADF